MLKDKHSPISPPSGLQYTINELISFDPILDEYFRKNAIPERYCNLAHDLMLDGIRYRAEQGMDHIMREKDDGRQFENERLAEREGAMRIENNERQFEKNNFERDYENENNYENLKHVNNSNNLNKGNSEENYYNVQYVKNNRFLSPKHRKEVITPKVTETIPVSSPQIIYGKPRVRVDDDFGCPYHENAEECLRSIPYGGPCEPNTPIELKNTQYEVHVKENPAFETLKKSNYHYNEHGNELLRYNSTPNMNTQTQAQIQVSTQVLSNEKPINEFQESRVHEDDEKKNNKKTQSKSKKQTEKELENGKKIKHKKQSSEIEQTVYVSKILEVENRFPGKVRVVKSPKNKIYQNEEESDSYLISHYEGNSQNGHGKVVDSKIKFLVERDKKSKAIEKNMKKQERRIEELEKMIKNSNKSEKQNGIIENDILSLSESSKSSEMSMMDSQQMKNYKNNLSKKLPKTEKRNSAAYFGTAELHHLHNQLNTEILDCSCSKTFSEDDSVSEIDERNSEFSQFK